MATTSLRPSDKIIVDREGRIKLEWDAYFRRLEGRLEEVIAAAGVVSFEGRIGAVTSASGDYAASEITNVPSGDITATNVQAALDELDSEKYSAGDSPSFADETLTGYLDLTEIGAPSSPAANVARIYAVDSSGTTKIEVKDSGGTAHDLTHFTQSGAGVSLRTQLAKMRDILHVKDFGAAGDGVTNDDTALNEAKAEADSQRNAIVSLSGGRYLGGRNFITGSPIWTNHIEPTLMRFDKPSILGLFEGVNSTPDTINDDPVLWVQKYTQFDNGSDSNAQNVGGVFAEVIVKGSGGTGATETSAVWNGILGNTVLEGTNQGSEASPDYDLRGGAIGVAGFARSEKPNANVTTALWGYATSPETTDTEFDNVVDNFSTIGLEINVETRHKDPGPLSAFGIKGCTAGIMLGNFPSAVGVRDWSFGMVFFPIPEDGNFSSTDPNNWHGYHDGIFIDFYKRAGIRFGRSKSGAYGLLFPSSYAHADLRPSAAIHLGDNQANLGEYLGSTFNNNDFWHNAGSLFFRYSGTTNSILQSRSNVVTLPGNTTFSVTGGFVQNLTTVASAVNYFQMTNAATGDAPTFAATGSDTNVGMTIAGKGSGVVEVQVNSAVQARFGNVASAVNRWTLYGAATAGAPALAAEGSDTNITMELRAKGTGGVFVQTGGGTQFRVINIASSVNHIQAGGGATGVSPRLETVGSDTNIDLRLTPKGTGSLQVGTTGAMAANGTVATVLGSLGPTGSNTTVQEWLKVKNSAGTVRYIPCW